MTKGFDLKNLKADYLHTFLDGLQSSTSPQLPLELGPSTAEPKWRGRAPSPASLELLIAQPAKHSPVGAGDDYQDNMPLIRQYSGTLFTAEFVEDLLNSFNDLLSALARMDDDDNYYFQFLSVSHCCNKFCWLKPIFAHGWVTSMSLVGNLMALTHSHTWF